MVEYKEGCKGKKWCPQNVKANLWLFTHLKTSLFNGWVEIFLNITFWFVTYTSVGIGMHVHPPAEVRIPRRGISHSTPELDLEQYTTLLKLKSTSPKIHVAPLAIDFVLRISTVGTGITFLEISIGGWFYLKSNSLPKFQNNFTAESWRTFWLRTFTPTISRNFRWHTYYVKKSWYQKFQSKLSAIFFTRCDFLRRKVQLSSDFIKEYSPPLKSDNFSLSLNDNCSSSQSFVAIALLKPKKWDEKNSAYNAPVLMTEPTEPP